MIGARTGQRHAYCGHGASDGRGRGRHCRPGDCSGARPNRCASPSFSNKARVSARSAPDCRSGPMRYGRSHGSAPLRPSSRMSSAPPAIRILDGPTGREIDDHSLGRAIRPALRGALSGYPSRRSPDRPFDRRSVQSRQSASRPRRSYPEVRQERGAVAIATDDGRTLHASALIGADGIRSTVRSQSARDAAPLPIAAMRSTAP